MPEKSRKSKVDHDFRKDLFILKAIEARLHTVYDNNGERRNGEKGFRVIGNWLIRKDILMNYFKYTAPETALIPGFPVRNAIEALYFLIFGLRVSADISADAVFFRSNIRVFYMQKQMTLWIARHQRSPEKLNKAISSRKRFSSVYDFRQPSILEQGTTVGHFYILEELICGRTFGQANDWLILANKVLPSLFKFYDQSPIRHRRACDIYDTERINSQLVDMVSRVKWGKKWVPLPRFLKAVKECLSIKNETIPLCIGHGDLGKSNLVVSSDGNVALLDWEISRELPMAEELIKLVYQHPGLITYLSSEISRRTEDPVSMTPRRQFLLATLDIIAGMDNFQEGRPWGPKKIKNWLGLASMLIARPDY